MASETFLASFGLIGLRLVELNGIDPQRFAEQVGIASIKIPDAKIRLPAQLADECFAKAASLIPDPAFALRAAACWHPSNLGTLGYAWLSSGTLRTALKRLARFSRLIGEKAACRVEDGADAVAFIFDHGRGDTVVGNAMADYTLALIVDMCRTNFGPTLTLQSVTLRRPTPKNLKPYEQFFACPIDFGASSDSLVLERHIAERPLPSSNHELATTFDAILSKQLVELGSGDLLTRCKAWLLQELTSGEPSEIDLARAMGLSSRTLQRKLSEYDMTYRSVLEAVRYDLAMRYLDDPSKTVTDITFLLGFSEQSAFTRAFKRWSGKAPTAYRTDQAALA